MNNSWFDFFSMYILEKFKALTVFFIQMVEKQALDTQVVGGSSFGKYDINDIMILINLNE